MKVLHVVGARPNFMKIAPIMKAFQACLPGVEQVLVHTGQHYDPNMSQVFFEELEIPIPDVNLEVGSGSHAWQTAQVMLALEPILSDYQPDWVVVVGDVNSTLAAALVCSKVGVRVSHVEAGLRSFDRSMPEEINRLLTDQIADLLFTHSRLADENLLREGIPPDKIHFVGNVMIDTLVRLMPKTELRWPALRERFGLQDYILVTIHRPANVDDPGPLGEIMAALEEISWQTTVLFPAHPRTWNAVVRHGLKPQHPNFWLIEPLGYLDFLAMEAHADLVVTDSGGIQEETTYLGIPCLTVRPNTERPVTITQGTNRLVDARRESLVREMHERLGEGREVKPPPELWDGQAATRIVQILTAGQ